MAQKTAMGSLCSFSPIILRPWVKVWSGIEPLTSQSQCMSLATQPLLPPSLPPSLPLSLSLCLSLSLSTLGREAGLEAAVFTFNFDRSLSCSIYHVNQGGLVNAAAQSSHDSRREEPVATSHQLIPVLL